MKNKICFILLLIVFSIISTTAQKQNSVTNQPKTVRDFFMLLPNKYFDISDSKSAYLKRLLEVEDTANGYLRGGADAGQGGLEMTLFKRPNGTYIVGLYSFNEMSDDFYFLEYENGKWFDISKQIVPDYGKYRWYEFPRYGTTVKVYKKKFEAEEEGVTGGERQEKLYDLEWKNGEFTKMK